MNVLWIVNILFPEAQALLIDKGELKASGGWLLGSAEALAQDNNVQLSVATVSPLTRKLRVLKGAQFTYYVLPMGKGNHTYNPEYEHYWKQIKAAANPDIIHIHGTEYTHGLAYVRTCGAKNVVVSIQGMKSAYSPYYCSGLTSIEIIKHITFRDLVRGSLYKEQNDFKHSGNYEIELLKTVNHIIGRTSWDRAHTWAINPTAIYHFCNETLRPEFYDDSLWQYEYCAKHSIFLSQANYPIKGLHQVLKALPIILSHFPDTVVRIAGRDITHPQKRFGIPVLSGYGKIIKRLIHQYNLNAEDMKREYLHANVFICPSSIENSPNSLGEAQILGVPCIASYVGGTMDMMQGNEENLYRFEEVEMLAYKVCRIFARESDQKNMQDIANDRHNPHRNQQQLINIYHQILS